MAWKRKNAWRAVLVVLVLLVALRLALPYIVTRHVNNVLSELEGYSGISSDVSLSMIDGAYQIDSIRIFRKNQLKGQPLLIIPKTEVSIDWSVVTSGRIVSQVLFSDPSLLITQSQYSTENRTTFLAALGRLTPFKINRIKVQNGKVSTHLGSNRSSVETIFYNIQLDAMNLVNARKSTDSLPSRIYLQTRSIGDGQLNLAMKLNLVKEIPDIDLDLRFENINMPALNNVLKAHGGPGVHSGKLNVYSEINAKNGVVTGYIKPGFSQLKISHVNEVSLTEESAVWQSLVTFINRSFHEQRKNQYITNLTIDGVIHNEQKFLPALWNIFSNAFVNEYEASTTSLSFASRRQMQNEKIETAEPAVNRSKREIRREKRKERREDRRKRRSARKDKS